MYIIINSFIPYQQEAPSYMAQLIQNIQREGTLFGDHVNRPLTHDPIAHHHCYLFHYHCPCTLPHYHHYHRRDAF